MRSAPGDEICEMSESSWLARRKNRVLFVNDVTRTLEYASYMEKKLDGPHYYSNLVRTSKYTLVNFLPKSLFEQFRRIANFYFLVISLLQLCTTLSPTNEYSTVGPLMIVLFATMVKEGLEDRLRHRQDDIVNHQLVKALGATVEDRHRDPSTGKVDSTPPIVTGTGVGQHQKSNSSSNQSVSGGTQTFQSIYWKSLQVGHIVKVDENCQIPADIVVLFTSNDESDAMCETSSLDGESNLKVRHAIRWNQIMPIAVQDFGAALDAEIRCELPNKRLYNFDGVLRVSFANTAAKTSAIEQQQYLKTPQTTSAPRGPMPDVEEVPINVENILLRGMKLCNTKWIIGVVVGAGNDTKLMQNMKAVPSKFSRLDVVTNQCILMIFVVLFVACWISSIQAALFSVKVFERLEYARALPYVEKLSAASFVEVWVTYLILYNNMVPISLYISLEIVKWYQARRIENDPKMMCSDTGHGVTARTSNVNEDLGQIKYIFSDKTGTLTRNQMLFKVCSIGGIIYDGNSMKLRQRVESMSQGIMSSPFVGSPAKSKAAAAAAAAAAAVVNSSGRGSGSAEAGRTSKQALVTEKDVRPYHQLIKMIQNPSRYLGKEKNSIELARPFFRCLLLCHSVSVALNENAPISARSATTTSADASPNEHGLDHIAGANTLNGSVNTHDTFTWNGKPARRYFGSSPDEVALLDAASEFDCVFEERNGDVIRIRLFGNTESYRLLALNEFDSTRKCMSVVVKRILVAGDETGTNNDDAADDCDERTHVPSKVNRRRLPRQSSLSLLNDSRDGYLDLDRPWYSVDDEGFDDNPLSRRRWTENHIEDEDDILVFTKGADTVMFANAVNAQDISNLGLHVHYFAAMALRTLLLGYKTLSAREYVVWKAEFDMARKSLSNREQLCLDVAKKIETSIYLLGATGVEDLLQDGVRECIHQLSLAGVNIWMLTGDKDETAISVANMCGLIGEKSKMIIIKGKTKQDCLDEIANARRKLKREGLWVPGVASRNVSLVINGEALDLLLADLLTIPPGSGRRLSNQRSDTGHSDPLADGHAANKSDSASTKSAGSLPLQLPNNSNARQRISSRNASARRSIGEAMASVHASHEIFMELATQCCSVVACRLSPMQKAQVVSLMKSAPGHPLTLAIGDGGNDVSMIQEAHVGIGIYGHEGMQAVRAADFAIGTFKHLSRLLLVHGRWNHRRVARVILFSFYKNMALILTLFLFSFKNGYSGQTLYESYLMVGWNVLYTVLPIFVLGIADEDIRDCTVLKYPFVYRSSLKTSELSVSRLGLWMLNALAHSVLVLLITSRSLDGVSSHGKSSGLFTQGSAVYGVLVVTVTLKASLNMQRLHRWTRPHYFALVGGFSAFLIFVIFYSKVYAMLPKSDVFRDFYGIAGMLFAEGLYWMTVLHTCVACIVADFAITYLRHMYLPSSNDIILEIDSGLGEKNPGKQDEDASTCSSPDVSKRIEASLSRAEENASAVTGRSDLTSSLLDGEWSQKFLDFDRPTEHDELSKQLIMLQRELAQDIGMPDPILKEDETQSSRSLSIQPSVHPLTLEFMGEEHQKLENEFEITFALRERSRIILVLKILAIVIPLYAVYEYFWEKESKYIYIRLSYFICDILYMRVVRTNLFCDNYQVAILAPLCAIGMAFTLTISDTGKFAATLFPIAIFVVVRIKFLYALILALYNVAFYLLADKVGFKSESTSSQDMVDLALFAFYLAIVIWFGANSCYSLQTTMRRDFLQSRSLLIEQKRSTQILKNMLPEHVVQRMQKGETLIGEDEKDVTILFCDIADFASFVKRFSPTEVVSLLDRVYSLFDQICEKHGVRKMETVGKTYMACAGLQGKDRGREAALRAVCMALDMLGFLEKCRATNGNGIKLRIGIHSGRVVSGLVGMKKQQFSLFGDTVNTASRMQSTGVTGCCQISQVTYKKLAGHFTFEERQIDVKGKGKMTTYMLGEPVSEIALLAMSGQLDNVVKRNSVAFADTINSGRKTFDDFVATRHRLVQSAKRSWAKYDPIRFLLGSSSNSAPNSNHDSANVENDMLSEIQQLVLCFKDASMERKYLESTLADRVNGARRTLWVLALYGIFACLRDVITEVVNGDTYTHKSERTKAYVAASLSRFVYAVVVIFIIRRTHDDLMDFSETMLRNLLLGLYFVGLSCYILSCGFLWWLNFVTEIDISPQFVNMCLDTVLAMFVVSNGGSILHRHAVIFNMMALLLVTCVSLTILNVYKQDLSKFNTNFKTSYPIVLTYISVITNIIASQSVEFFTRRQIWLKTRTQLETMNADQLLYQMLPAAVVMRLKEGEMVCDQHQQVGILFSDIKGFTSIASQADTAQVVNILASLFCAFDKLTEKHGVFKMQTIGDAYVIVSGLPYVDMSIGPVMAGAGGISSGMASLRSATNRVLPLSVAEVTSAVNGDQQGSRARSRRSTLKQKFQMHIRSHIRDLLAMARDMHKEVRKVQDPNTGERLQMRIGIHVGNIIGGVIGTTTLRYDMWGPDALTANELESNGVPEKILVSPIVVDVVRGMPDIQCTFYKKTNFTNVSMMDTYLVEFIEPPDGDMSGTGTSAAVPIGSVADDTEVLSGRIAAISSEADGEAEIAEDSMNVSSSSSSALLSSPPTNSGTNLGSAAARLAAINSNQSTPTGSRVNSRSLLPGVSNGCMALDQTTL